MPLHLGMLHVFATRLDLRLNLLLTRMRLGHGIVSMCRETAIWKAVAVTNGKISALITTVNVPFRTYMDEVGLAAALIAGEVKTGQVESFYTEIKVEAQKEFAEHINVSEDALIASAKKLAEWSGQQIDLLR